MSAKGWRIDRLGALLCLVGLIAFAIEPFWVFKANRIVSGSPRFLADVLPLWFVIAVYTAAAVIAIVALFSPTAGLRLAAALGGLAIVAKTVGWGGTLLTPVGNKIVRVSPGAAFWMLAVVFALLATDALTRLRPGPAARIAMLALTICIVGATFYSGLFDDLSIMREYAVRASNFTREAQQHLWLALGSLAAAVAVGLPLGITCHRVPRLRNAILQTLNMVQTIPSIALFGILMVPLGALAAAVPLAAELGIRGIGTAPAIVGLFLYSLLPVVANTVVGLGQVSPVAVDAARGMGLTERQVLTDVELILAMPVVLTGIRIVLVQNIGLVTIAALIGGGGFGTFVFQGIGQSAIDLVLLGAVPTVALAFSSAVVLDALIDFLKRVPQ